MARKPSAGVARPETDVEADVEADVETVAAAVSPTALCPAASVPTDRDPPALSAPADRKRRGMGRRGLFSSNLLSSV